MNRALRARGAALRGVRVPLVPSVRCDLGELGDLGDLGAMMSDLGRGHSSDLRGRWSELERVERPCGA